MTSDEDDYSDSQITCFKSKQRALKTWVSGLKLCSYEPRALVTCDVGRGVRAKKRKAHTRGTALGSASRCRG